MLPKPATLIGAAVLVTFHFVVAMMPLLQWHLTSGIGEWVVLWDAPLELLLGRSQFVSDIVMRGSGVRYVLYIGLGGTLMYGMTGALIGYFFDCVFERFAQRDCA